MIEIYGSPNTSASRCFWMLEELGVPYQPKPIDMRAKEHKGAEYLKLNPNGKVPTLKDGDFVIWESMAINTYLADKYDSPLRGQTAEERGLINQWSYWAILDLQKPLIDIFIQIFFVPEERRDQALIEKARSACPRVLSVLEQKLAGKKFLVSERFTLADLNVASVARLAEVVGMDISPYKNIQAWLRLCKDRPAYQKFARLEK